MADIARLDYRIRLSFIGEKWGLIIEYQLNFKPTFWTGLPCTPLCVRTGHLPPAISVGIKYEIFASSNPTSIPRFFSLSNRVVSTLQLPKGGTYSTALFENTLKNDTKMICCIDDCGTPKYWLLLNRLERQRSQFERKTIGKVPCNGH